MKIRLLGTAAAEGIPAFYADNRVADYARKHGGREIRTRSGALVDGELKIDFGPDTLAHIQRDGLDAREWLGIAFTHSHDDHCCLTQLQYLVWPFGPDDFFPFPIYGNAGVCAKLDAEYPDWPIELHETRSFEPYDFGPYRITPIRANHMLEEDAHNLIVELEGKRFLYGTDTGWWADETWEFLEAQRLDCLVLECTSGRLPADYWGHLNLDQHLAAVERLRQAGVLDQDAIVVSTHHSHNGDMTYRELVEALTPHDVIAGYDGLEIDL